MWYVYMRVMCSGREEFIGVYDSPEEAIDRISMCYRIDQRCKQLGDYYYFMKKH